MISITRADVPECLRDGELFRSLAAEEGESFEVPATVFKQNLSIENNEDLGHALSSLRYWVVSTPPVAVIRYCLDLCTVVTPCRLMLRQYATELPYCKFLEQNMGRDHSMDTMMRAALRSGYVELVRYVVSSAEQAGGLNLSGKTFIAALEGDNLECLAFVVSKGQPTNVGGHQACARSVACLEYLLEHCPDYKPNFGAYAVHGDTTLVDVLLKRRYCWNGTPLHKCTSANGLHMIRHLHERGCSEWGGVVETAAYYGHVEIVQYAHEHGAPWAAGTLYRAAANKRWECFAYALEHGCPYSSRDACEVARHSATMLRYLRERGCEVDVEQCLRCAILSGCVDVLRYLRGEGVAWPDDALVDLVRYGGIAALQFAHEDGLPFDRPEAYCQAMCLHGEASLLRIRFLHEHGCPWNHTAVAAALNRGHRECLEYLLRHGCPVVPSDYPKSADAYLTHPMYLAAFRGDAQALHSLLRHGCRVLLSPEQMQAVQYETCHKLLLECVDD